LGNLFVAAENRIFKISQTSNLVTTYVGNPDHGSSAENVSATAVLLSSAQRITGDSYGNLYYADNCKIRKVLAGSRLISTMIGTGSCSYNGENTAALSTQLQTPLALWFDTVGNLTFGDDSNNRIRKWSVATGLVATIAGNGTSGFSDSLPATSAMFKSVYGIAGDTNGNIYFSDYEDNRVTKFTAAGILVTYAGNGGSSGFTENSLAFAFAGNGNYAFAGDGGPAKSAQLYNPLGTFVDTNGNVYIADQYNCRLRVVNALGLISTIGGTATCSALGDNGPVSASSFNHVRAIWKVRLESFLLAQVLGSAKLKQQATLSLPLLVEDQAQQIILQRPVIRLVHYMESGEIPVGIYLLQTIRDTK
jgi:hypothetical protein